MALLAFAPAAASATTLAHCERYDTSGLVAPWSSAKLSQPDEETRWSVETGRLVRLSARGSEERELADERLLSVAFPTSQEGWTVGESGVVFHTGDGGRHWDRRPVGQERNLRLVRCADAVHCAIVADDGTLLHTKDGGRQWTPAPLRVPSDVTDMYLLDPEHGWMVSGSGAFLETHDGGVTWSRRAIEHALGRPDASIEVVRFADPQLGWIASGNRLLRTTDGGATWEVALRLEDGLSFFAVASPDGRQVQAGVGGECHDFERSGGNYRSEDGGATWADVVGAEESEADWEALVRDSSTNSHLTHAFRTRVLDQRPTGFRAEVTEAWPDAHGLRVRRLLVRQRSCGDVEVASREEPAWPGWAASDPCGLDAEHANEVLARFADQPASDETRLFVTCGEVQKTFRLPRSIPRRQLRRVSSSLLGLMGLVDRLHTSVLWSQVGEGERNAGALNLPLLKSGRLDAGFERPATLRDILARYEGPLPPKGALGLVEVELPAGVSLRQDVRPPYPEVALQARVEGRVVLDLVVDADGVVRDVERVAGIPLLDEAALKAVRQWRFEPGAATNPVRVSLVFVIDPCARGGRVLSYE